jgi:cytoskeletal protein CcmA (bactofilin family)
MAMFGNSNSSDKKETTKSSSASISPGSHALNSIVQGTVVEGSVNSKSDFRVDGTIKGKLFCDAKVIIGPTGLVEGEIRCKNAMIEGNFEGILNVEELLSIKESAKVQGDITTGKLIVSSGAQFNGNCNMGNEKRSSSFNDIKAGSPSAAKVGQPSKV